MDISVRELTHQEINGIFPFIQQLNPNMTEGVFHERLQQMLQQNYHCAAAFDEKGECLGISGFWVQTRFWCGTHIHIDNVVIDSRFRSKGVGKKLMSWIENWGVERGYHFAVLDSYTHNIDSHRFYFREGYVIRGFHFTKDLK
jgi:GNAT superfamily N-acetyltransferase